MINEWQINVARLHDRREISKREMWRRAVRQSSKDSSWQEGKEVWRLKQGQRAEVSEGEAGELQPCGGFFS